MLSVLKNFKSCEFRIRVLSPVVGCYGVCKSVESTLSPRCEVYPHENLGENPEKGGKRAG